MTRVGPDHQDAGTVISAAKDALTAEQVCHRFEADEMAERLKRAAAWLGLVTDDRYADYDDAADLKT